MAYQCGTATLTAYLIDHTIAVPLRCKQWSCPPCASRNKKRLLRRLRATGVTHLITLTCRPSNYHYPSQAFYHLSTQLPNLVKRLRRAFPAAPIEYLAVWETTKRGWPHVHLLARTSYIPQAVLSNHWQALTGAPIVDIRRVQGPRAAANYVAKYLTKDPSAPLGCKRWRSSRRWWDSPGGLLGRHVPSALPWEFVPLPIGLIHLVYPYGMYWHQPQPNMTLRILPRPPPFQ